MTSSFGDIPLSDYTKILRSQRPNRLMRLAKALGATFACVALTAAGDYLSPWTGKNSLKLSLADATHILENASAPEWQTELGAGALFGHIQLATARLFEVAKRDDKTGLYASGYVYNLSRETVAYVQQLASLGVHAEMQERSLNKLREQLRVK